MQVLFQSSSESPSTPGLGIIPYHIDTFTNTDKSVPHMGWNSVHVLDDENAYEAADERTHYYFVHSFRASYDPDNAVVTQWTHSTTQYGQEIFVASVRKDNVYGVQFHPEKSGPAGLKLIDTWLKQTESTKLYTPSSRRIPPTLKPKHGLTKRIIACMDIRTNDQGDLVVTKGDQYDVREKSTAGTDVAGVVRNLGKPVALAARYAAAGADELCLLNITSFRHSPLRDQPMLAVVLAASREVFVPLTIGGGIKDSVDPDGTKRSALDVAGVYFRAGADKISIGSEAVYAVEKLRASGSDKGDGTSAIETIAHVYGRQAVVVSIDPRRVYVDQDYSGPYRPELVFGETDDHDTGRNRAWWYQCTVSGGREPRPLSVVQLAQGAETLGAGEILLNSIDRDGTGLGFDLALITLVRNSVRIPVVASSGAGSKAHFVDVFRKTGVEAALAAGIFHRGEVQIQHVKEALRDSDTNVRLV
jgi:imidazole glycerol-phosphate synthase